MVLFSSIRVLFSSIIGEYALNARSAEALLFVNMGDNALNAKSAEALLSVNMGNSALDAKSAEAVLFVNMESTLSMQRVQRRFFL
jgi:hypothetical protein